MNKNFTFGGITVFQLEDMKDKMECIFATDDEIILLTNKTYKHEEEGLNFEYKYAISAIDMRAFTGDEQFTEDNAFCIEIYLVVSPTSLDKNVMKDIKESTCGYCEYQDILQYGLGVRMLYENKGYPVENIEEIMYKIANFIEPMDHIRGFYLDRYVNKISSTGWDLIFNCVDGESFIKRAIKRIS